ncbi:glycyl-tRNA synthetase, beta subunit [Evansella cellulosilytica DSM 2522]|uniref:Glycine--tRNA ligase beta subunit n=2 Tax=Evansella TaxID=2837485 RepID=E6TW51_EVAC2|nr:glycyl-tRNA synthetase, beta subunit [Evansella cellulosilytica DSM 2522]
MSMSKQTFLFEIGLEEMPARFVTTAMNQLAEKVEKWLLDNRLNYEAVQRYSTPRRLAIKINGLDDRQADIEEEAKGPSKKIAQDADGNWTKAAEGFARGQGVSVSDLFFKEIKGEEYVFVNKFMKGTATNELLQDLKEVAISLQFPKNMRWGSLQFRYVRPIKWLVALYGSEVIPFEIAHVPSSNVTYGHRFLGEEITLSEANEYENLLLSQYVIADPEQRKEAIRSQVKYIGEQEGYVIPVDEDLLEEINNLVEYPTSLIGNFDERFLMVPSDVLITSMREHQRYFPVKDSNGNLLPHFITVRNGDHRHLENVQKGNEKVLRARLADAEFFYEEDLKQPLDANLERLESIVYHEELGSIGDKVRRIQGLATTFAEWNGLNEEELKTVLRVAQLSKADLVTHMVGEFPELEGRMGEEYARKSGEDEKVAQGIYEHYLPKQAGDQLPKTSVGALVSVADKVDTIVTSFSIGLIPTGSQDPHGLRRQTAGVIQIFLANKWKINVLDVFKEALQLAEKHGLLKRDKETVLEELVEFIKLRVKNILQDKGIRYDIVDAVMNTDIGEITTLVDKANVLQSKINETSFKKLVEAFSRVTNIAKKAKDNQHMDVNDSLFTEKAEKDLFKMNAAVSKQMNDLLKSGNVEAAFDELKQLEPYIHDYFDHVMVMTDDTALKTNRLNQMNEAAKLITQFAEFQSIVFHSEE